MIVLLFAGRASAQSVAARSKRSCHIVLEHRELLALDAETAIET
jgi:hypothetical protein